MKPMSLSETKAIKGGAFSGAILTGIAAIIEGFNTLITNIGGMAFAFSNPQHIKGEAHFNKNFNFSWDDTKALQTTSIANKWTDQIISNNAAQKSDIWNFQ